MKNFLLFLLSSIAVYNISAQEINQTILVEHYTNTRCGVCANNNPALYSLIADYNQIHLAYSPSSPYSSCVFSMHNSTEADGRTNYYNIFGSTPRVVLNGEVVPPGNPILQESRMDAEVSNMTPFRLEVTQEHIDADSVKVSITVATVATTNITNLTLQVMLAEKLVNYNAPNGEEEHPDVFRKALYGLNGKDITIPQNGTDTTFELNYTFDPEWVKEDIEIIAFLQDESDKSTKQAAVSPRLGAYTTPTDSTTTTSINTIKGSNIEIFPNPTKDILNIKGLEENTTIQVYNIIGKQVYKTLVEKNTINISELPKGIYLLEIIQEDKRFVQKINKI